jgi:xanthine dehydrogenase accessory factor
MRDVLSDLDRWDAAGQAAAVATVLSIRRSAPRAPGSKMAVSASGEVAGMISGGCVEGSVVETCLEVIDGAPPRSVHYGIADEEAWGVGLPCGGEIEVWISRWEPSGAPARLAALAREGGRGALVTLLDGSGAALFLDADGATEGGLGDAQLDAAAREAAGELMWAERSERRPLGPDAADAFVDVVYPSPRLLIVGAIDLAGALCRVARTLGWRPWVIDPRPAFATQRRFPDAEEVIVAWPQKAFAQLGIDRATAVAALTHDPKIDDAALEIALRSEASYVGAMGSRPAQARRRERLLELGLGDAELDRLAAPIGLDLGALSPEETALSVMAEIVALRHGRDGGRLRVAAGRIHDIERPDGDACDEPTAGAAQDGRREADAA